VTIVALAKTENDNKEEEETSEALCDSHSFLIAGSNNAKCHVILHYYYLLLATKISFLFVSFSFVFLLLFCLLQCLLLKIAHDNNY